MAERNTFRKSISHLGSRIIDLVAFRSAVRLRVPPQPANNNNNNNSSSSSSSSSSTAVNDVVLVDPPIDGSAPRGSELRDSTSSLRESDSHSEYDDSGSDIGRSGLLGSDLRGGGDGGGLPLLRSSNWCEFIDDEEYDDDDEGHDGARQTDEYVALSPELIFAKQLEAIQHVQSILEGLPTTAVRVLLSKYKWDAPRLLAAFAEHAEAVCAEAGFPMLEMDKLREQHADAVDSGVIECMVCADEVERQNATRLACGHTLCNDCWKEFLTVHVREKATTITCPCLTTAGEKCTMTVDDFTVLKLLAGDAEQEKRFQQALVDSFVNDNPMIQWCPAPGCENAVQLLSVSLDRNEAVVCLCGFSFCFRCQNEEHRPCSCKMVLEWKLSSKNSDTDSLALHYLLNAGGRPCPNCSAPIEKNDGCHHMNCVACDYHFCWSCNGKFGSGPLGGNDGYHNHICGTPYSGATSSGAMNEDKLKEVQRFIDHQSRYTEQQQTWKLEEGLLLSIESAIAELLSDISTYRRADDYQYLFEAVLQLKQNRHTLSQAEIFSFFRKTMAPHVNESLFQYLKDQLNSATTALSQEMRVRSDWKTVNKATIVALTTMAKSAHKALLSASSEWAVHDNQPHFIKRKKGTWWFR